MRLLQPSGLSFGEMKDLHEPAKAGSMDPGPPTTDSSSMRFLSFSMSASMTRCSCEAMMARLLSSEPLSLCRSSM